MQIAARNGAVAEEGVPVRPMAELFGRLLSVPVVSIKPEEAPAHFGFLAMFAGLDMPASSAKTRAELGWKPKEIGLMADMSRPAISRNENQKARMLSSGPSALLR